MSNIKNPESVVKPTEAAGFLVSWPSSKIHVTAIHPDRAGPDKVRARTFDKSDKRLANWVGRGIKNGYGIYFNGNDLGADLSDQHKHAFEDEVTRLIAFHVDADVDKSITDPVTFETAKADLLEGIHNDPLRPSYIIDSGNGFGCFWVLKEPVKVTPENRGMLRAINIALSARFGGDKCHDLCHVMRVPGTVNYPNELKRKRNRPTSPTRLITGPDDFDYVIYTLDDFAALATEAPPAPSAEANIPDDIPATLDLAARLKNQPDLYTLIREGKGKLGDGSRSSVTYAAAAQLMGAGFTDGEIVHVILNPNYAISATIREAAERSNRSPEGQAARLVADLHKKGAAPEDVFAELPDNTTMENLAKEHDASRYSYRDFLMYLPEQNKFIFIPAGADEMWPAASVDRVLPWPRKIDPDLKAKHGTHEAAKAAGLEYGLYETEDGKPVTQKPSEALKNDGRQRVAAMTWWPGKPTVILDTLISRNGVAPKQGMNTYNRYRRPRLTLGAVRDPQPWLDHVKLLYPEDWQHIVHWLAYRVQRPDIKILHALVLGGAPRIGKDRLLAPVPYAVGVGNFSSTNAQTIMDEPKYNSYLEAVICLINEAQDFGEHDRFAFYNRTKPWIGGTAAGVLMVADKFVRIHPVLDVVGLIITTNFKVRGLYLPPDDARHYVAWSNRTREDWGTEEAANKYFQVISEWYESGGTQAVANYLMTLDLGEWLPTAPPPKTAAWHEIVNAYRNPNESVLAEILENLGDPPAVTVTEVHNAAAGKLDWYSKGGRNTVPAEMEAVGYVIQRNTDSKGGRWQAGSKTDRREFAIYVKASLGPAERMSAAREVHKREQQRPSSPSAPNPEDFR